MQRIYRIGTRTSPLALKQVEEIVDSLERVYGSINTEVVGIQTYGDFDKKTPISKIEGTDFLLMQLIQLYCRAELILQFIARRVCRIN